MTIPTYHVQSDQFFSSLFKDIDSLLFPNSAMSSSISYSPTLPSLRPRLVDPLWLKLDEPRDENVELERFEKFHTPKAHMEVANMKVEPPIGVDPANQQGMYNMSCSNLRTPKV